MLRLVGIGALGSMLSPAAKHLNDKKNIACFIRVHDRGSRDPAKDTAREAWIRHGAKLVKSLEELIEQDDFDGVLICAGKNGDDVKIISSLIPLINAKFSSKKPFILHLSTVSTEFVIAAYQACELTGIKYLNYPLTGGAQGALTGNMLILASGNKTRFEQLRPTLECLGKPKYFDDDITTATRVKFIGHLMVFNGLIGISSAVLLHTKCLRSDAAGQSEFFDFLNQGSGGTKQWDTVVKQAVKDNIWNKGFLLHHAVVDAIYVGDLLIKMNMPLLTVQPILNLTLGFCYVIQENPHMTWATQALIKAMTESSSLDQFFTKYVDNNKAKYLENCIEALPGNLKKKVKLDITVEDFRRENENALD